MAAEKLEDFRRLADDLPWPIWTHSSDGAVDWANRAWYEFARLPRAIATNAEGWTRVVHPDDYPALLQRLADVVAADAPLELELRLKPDDAPSDGYRWFLIRSQPQYDAEGRLLYRLGSAMDVHAARARNEEEARGFKTVAEGVPEILWMASPDGALDWYNARWYEYTGQTVEEAAAWGWGAANHPDDLPQVMERWKASLASGEPVEVNARIRRHDGVYRWFLSRALPARDASGAIVRWCGTSVDVDEARRARDRERLYAEMTAELSRALSLDDTLRIVTRLIAPSLADYAIVNLIGEDGEPRCAAVYHHDATARALLSTLLGATYSLPQASAGSREALRLGRPTVYDPVPPAMFEGFRPGFREVFERVGLESGMAVPLLDRGRVVGTLAAGMSGSERHFAQADVVLFEELARRISPALANASAYERERRVARTFQAAAMEQTLPSVPGLRFDAMYEAAHAEATVGGDWYDALRLPDGRVVLSIGDVAGSGLDAAVAMASVRQSIRTAALINPEPGAVLDAVDRIVRAMSSERFVTVFVALFDPLTFELRAASAGHPAPVLRAPDGRTSMLPLAADLPLGLRHRNAAAAGVTRIEPGSMLLAYTDGLLEFDRDAVAGERALLAAAASAAGDRPAHEVYEHVVGGRPGRDDIAVFAVSFDAPLLEVNNGAYAAQWVFAADDAQLAGEARRAYAARLRAAGLAEDQVVSAELIFGELVGNVYRYAPGEVVAALDLSSAAPVLHVLDRGDGFEFRPRLPTDLLSERGRGLFLATALAEELSVERREGVGSHARVVLAAGHDARGAWRERALFDATA